VGDPSFRLKNGCTQDDPDTWAEDFKLSHYRSLNNIAFCHSESERFGGEETAAGREKQILRVIKMRFRVRSSLSIILIGLATPAHIKLL
jgi:hypothetical protein